MTPHPALPYTILRLRALRPGESCVYYRGNFSTDIDNATPSASSLGAPTYRAHLIAIKAAAEELAAAGVIQLSTRPVKIIVVKCKGKERREIPVWITEYIAQARQAKDAANDNPRAPRAAA
jgi:hypothetical protein